jgi:hypothetical protein
MIQILEIDDQMSILPSRAQSDERMPTTSRSDRYVPTLPRTMNSPSHIVRRSRVDDRVWVVVEAEIVRLGCFPVVVRPVEKRRGEIPVCTCCLQTLVQLGRARMVVLVVVSTSSELGEGVFRWSASFPASREEKLFFGGWQEVGDTVYEWQNSRSQHQPGSKRGGLAIPPLFSVRRL